MNQKSCSEFSLAPKTQKTKKNLVMKRILVKKVDIKTKKHTSRYYEQIICERKILNKKSKV